MKHYLLPIFKIIIILPAYVQGQNLQLAPIFGNHMVIQEGINAPVWGKSKPGSIVKVDFAGYATSTKTNDDGNWMLRMPILSAGGPYVFKVYGIDTIIFHDVMVGEVWFASGQSNMEWTVGKGVGFNVDSLISGDNVSAIRFFNVPKKTSPVPLKEITARSEWIVSSSKTITDFSALAYFFSRELNKYTGRAIGIICAAWGATNIEAWISQELLETHVDFNKKIFPVILDTFSWNSYVRNCLKSEQDREVIASTSRKGLEAGVIKLQYDDTNWEKCTEPFSLESTELNGYWGILWLRKTISLKYPIGNQKVQLITELVARDAIIYLNGKKIKHLVNPEKTYIIDIPAGTLKKGDNILAIRLYAHWGVARVGKKGQPPFIILPDRNVKISIDGEWKYNYTIEPHVAQWQDYYNKPSVLFNGMVNPIIPYGIKGVIWYQGENNAGNGYQYRSLLPLLFEDWRIRWQLGYLPFLYVQLPNYKEKNNEPVESEWAELREAQLMALKYPRTGMAVTIDIGEADNIHPKNKLEVARRLALLALKHAYNENIISSGPIYKDYKIEGNKIRISFTEVGSGLAIRGCDTLKGFAIAGADRIFNWAKATIENNEIVVYSSVVQLPQSVRYSWADNPDGNLINKEGLPASPFRTDDWKNPIQK